MEPEGLFCVYKRLPPVPVLSIKFITDKNCMYISHTQLTVFFI